MRIQRVIRINLMVTCNNVQVTTYDIFVVRVLGILQ